MSRLEKDVEREIVKALSKMGFFVSTLSQGYRPGGRRHATTRQTKGIPDLYFQHPRHGTGWLEVKGPETPVTSDQRAWHARERASAGRVAIVRSVADAMWALSCWGVPVTPPRAPSEEMVEQFRELEHQSRGVA